MKRSIALVALCTTMLFSVAVTAVAGDKDKGKAPVITVTGEIVDTGCYLGRGAKGESHQSCAVRCIANGMAMALLTDDDVLYLLTMSHSDADPYNNAKKMAALTVDITGPVHERNGMKSIEVTSVKEVNAKAKSKG